MVVAIDTSSPAVAGWSPSRFPAELCALVQRAMQTSPGPTALLLLQFDDGVDVDRLHGLAGAVRRGCRGLDAVGVDPAGRRLVVVLPGLGRGVADRVAERARQLIEVHQPGAWWPALRIGLAVSTEAAGDAVALLAGAENALRRPPTRSLRSAGRPSCNRTARSAAPSRTSSPPDVVDAREEERLRLARELHDGPMGRLARLSAALRRRGTTAEAGLALELPMLREVGEAVSQTLAELRRINRNLRPISLDVLGLDAAVSDLLADVSRLGGPRTTLRRRGATRRLDPAAELDVFRIVQEAVTNAWRHGQAGRVDVLFSFTRQRFSATVRDDGRGFDTNRPPGTTPGGHCGLIHMHERARHLGGQVRVRSAVGKGTTVVIRVPLGDGGTGR